MAARFWRTSGYLCYSLVFLLIKLFFLKEKFGYVIDDVELLFESDEGVYIEHLRPLFVAKHEIKDKQLRERMKQLPSVLGCDILDKFAFIRDRRKEIVIITDHVGEY